MAAQRTAGVSIGQAITWVVFLSLLFWPRLFIIGFALFDNQFETAYDHWIVPAVGFLILPWTTVAYALMWGAGNHEVYGIEWAVVGVAFLIDLIPYASIRPGITP